MRKKQQISDEYITLCKHMLTCFGDTIIDIPEDEQDAGLFYKAMFATSPLSYNTFVHTPALHKWISNEIIVSRLHKELKTSLPQFGWLNYWKINDKKFYDLVPDISEWFKPMLMHGNVLELSNIKSIGLHSEILEAANELYNFKQNKSCILSEDKHINDIYLGYLRMTNKLKDYNADKQCFINHIAATKALFECLVLKYNMKENEHD